MADVEEVVEEVVEEIIEEEVEMSVLDALKEVSFIMAARSKTSRCGRWKLHFTHLLCSSFIYLGS